MANGVKMELGSFLSDIQNEDFRCLFSAIIFLLVFYSPNIITMARVHSNNLRYVRKQTFD